MLKKFDIASSAGSYEVLIGGDFVSSHLSSFGNKCIVDQKVSTLWGQLFEHGCIEFEASEQNKTFGGVEKIISELRERGVARASRLAAIGGGIVQDVSTLSASTYMRGVKWEYYPTTLLGMVDSCIGGKSSINVGEFKNLAGNFYPPEKVIIDTSFCKTLEEVQIIEGLFEALKICYAESPSAFQKYLSLINLKKSLYDLDFIALVELSLLTKKRFIEEDEFDQGIRLLLNFGHTFGHAIEAATHFKIKHGVAVGLGILIAYHLSIELGLIDESNQTVMQLIDHVKQLLVLVPELKSIVSFVDPVVYINKFSADKKHTIDNYVAILFGSDGQLIRHSFKKSQKIDQLIVDSFMKMVGQL